MAFLGSLFSNILSVWLLGLTEKGKYTKISSAIYQVFIVSIIILLLMVPVYLISVGTDISYASYVSVLHIMIAAQASALILEIISNYRYALVGVYVAKLKKEVRVAVTGVESFVFRCKKIEEALSSNFSSSAIDSVTISSKGFNADIHASAEYRAHIIKVMAKKAVSSC